VDRRNFGKNTLLNLFSFTALGSLLATAKPKKKIKKVFVHQVYFWLKNPGNQADTDKLVEGLEALAKVAVIKQYHIGKPAGTPREVVDGTYAISWLTMFDNAADQDVYQVDPIHLKFVENYKHLWEKVAIYDSVDLA
jgi:hypothetical protein